MIVSYDIVVTFTQMCSINTNHASMNNVKLLKSACCLKANRLLIKSVCKSIVIYMTIVRQLVRVIALTFNEVSFACIDMTSNNHKIYCLMHVQVLECSSSNLLMTGGTAQDS